MTSPLRRKPRTTARSMTTVRDWALLVVAGFAVGAFAQAAPAATPDDDPAGDGSSVQATSYSTGKTGSRLKWLGRKPNTRDDGEMATRTSHDETTPEDSCDTSSVQPAQDLQPSIKTWSKSLGGDRKPAERTDDQGPNSDKTIRQPVRSPGLIDALSPKQHPLDQSCPSPKSLKPINKLETDIEPDRHEAVKGVLPHYCSLGDEVYQPRAFSPITYTWTAAALCHKPLYFEDVQLERYGHMAGPWVQPFASAANFFCTFPILPYKMGLELPNECMYTLGYYRPGSCAPYLFDPLPISVRGLFYEGGGWVAGCALFP
jgi:hypothetical protein